MGIHTGKMRLQPAKCSRCSPEMMVDRRFSPTLLKQGHAVGIPCNQQYNRSRINFERCLHKCHSTKRINHLFYLFWWVWTSDVSPKISISMMMMMIHASGLGQSYFQTRAFGWKCDSKPSGTVVRVYKVRLQIYSLAIAWAYVYGGDTVIFSDSIHGVIICYKSGASWIL